MLANISLAKASQMAKPRFKRWRRKKQKQKPSPLDSACIWEVILENDWPQIEKKIVYDYLKTREIQMTNNLRINKIALRSRVEGCKINWSIYSQH